MIEARDHDVTTTERVHERAAEVLADLVSVANADRVYSAPVVAGDRTVITAAEVQTGMGFGYGLDTGEGGRGTDPDEKGRVVSRGWGWRHRGEAGARGGGGGGGQAAGRPVAVITIDPDGVRVQPVLDRTKIAVTALLAFGAIGLTLLRGRRR
jgi:uncharacterized spore protein YtfJ